ncbi:MAG: heme NO-binding domain-containing protein [Planctomycetota bacterium]
MKGVIFTELMEMIESKFGFDVVDRIIDEADLESGGVYTATGTYSHLEAVQIVMALSNISGISPGDLQLVFGEHLFGRLLERFPQCVGDEQDLFSFLESIEEHIHVQVLKLHPEAQLPSFECERSADGRMLSMTYSSARHFDAIAEGLIRGAAAHFVTPVSIESEPVPGGAGTIFRIREAGAEAA